MKEEGIPPSSFLVTVMMHPEKKFVGVAKGFDLTSKDGFMVFSDYLQDIGEPKWANIVMWLGLYGWDGKDVFNWFNCLVTGTETIPTYSNDVFNIMLERVLIGKQLPVIPYGD